MAHTIRLSAARCVDRLICSSNCSDVKGLFGAAPGDGERHITRRPFGVLPIPRYDPDNPRHRELAELSLVCHERVRHMLTEPGLVAVPSGWLPARVREALRAELEVIDRCVRKVLTAG